MTPPFNFRSRRAFLKNAGLGCGSLAMTSLLNDEGILSKANAAEPPTLSHTRPPHFAPKAKSVIWLFMPGSPSQMDTLRLQTGTSKTGRDPGERR